MISFEFSTLADGDRLHRAQAMMSLGQKEGAIPADRPPLDGDEDAIFALSGNETVGVAVFFKPKDENELWLDILYVFSDFRRQGIGAALVECVWRRAGALGLARVRFGTLASNKAMQGLAERKAFGGSVYYERETGK